MIQLFVRAVTIGASAAASPGPLQTFVISSALSHGWRKSLPLAIAPFIADLPIILLVFTVVGQFPPAFLSALRLIGGIFVIYLAYSGYREYRAGAAMAGGSNLEYASSIDLLRRAVVMNILSPMPWVVWTTIHAPNVFEIKQMGESIVQTVLYIALFYGTFFIGLALIIIIFDRMRTLDPRITRKIILISIIALAVLGFAILGQGIVEVAALFQNAAVSVN